MIKFTTVRYKNFLSSGQYPTVIQLDKSPTTLIYGGNGAGKTTVCEAILFALYGKTLRGANKPDLINTINKKDCVCEVEFEINKKQFKVIRGIKPNIFEIHCDGEIVEQDSKVLDYQKYLEDVILQINYKTFTQVTVLGSASFTPFMKLTAGERRIIVENILGIEVFQTMNILAKSNSQQYRKEVDEAETKVKFQESKMDMQKKHIAQIDEIAAEEQKKIAESIDSYSNKNKELKEEILKQKQIVDDLLEQFKETDKYEGVQTQYDKLQWKLKEKLKDIELALKFFTTNDECPTCNQAIDLTWKEQQTQAKSKKVEEINTGLQVLQKKIETNNNNLASRGEINKSLEDARFLMAKLIDQYKNNEQFVKDLKQKVNKSTQGSVAEAQRTLQELIQQYKDLQVALFDAGQRMYITDLAVNLLKDSGIKAQIVKQYIPHINKLINMYLKELDFFASIELDERFNECLKARGKDELSYSNFSEGEKMRVNLAILFTWREIAKLRSSVDTNLLFFDETFDSSLDQDGVDDLFKLINTLKKTNLFVVSHKGDALFDKFRSVIHFEKVAGFSRIV